MTNTIELKLRLNEDTREVEVLANEEVLGSSGTELFNAWVNWANEKDQPSEEERRQAELEANLEAARAEVERLKAERVLAAPEVVTAVVNEPVKEEVVVQETPESSASAEVAQPSS